MSEELAPFLMRINNLELRTCDVHLIHTKPLSTMDIIEWRESSKGPFCFVVAYWKRDNEGYELRAVGSRPFDSTVDPLTFMELAARGQKILTDYYWKSKSEEF